MAIIAEKLSVANYNKLDNIPVINQDLSATDFTPVANTYYRHTGATTDTFTQGVIYLYDTAYHKLGESGGGTTLNRYTYTIPTNPSSSVIGRVKSFMQFAKGRVFANIYDTSGFYTGEIIFANSGTSTNNIIVRKADEVYGTESYYPIIKYYSYMAKQNYYTIDAWTYKDDGTTTFNHSSYSFANGLQIVYYNDAEIT